MTLTEQDNDRTIELPLNAEIEVRLNENRSTGYRWAIDSADAFEFIDSRFEAVAKPGAPGVRAFRFRASRSGSSALRLKKWREWEGPESIVDRFGIAITVKRPA